MDWHYLGYLIIVLLATVGNLEAQQGYSYPKPKTPFSDDVASSGRPTSSPTTSGGFPTSIAPGARLPSRTGGQKPFGTQPADGYSAEQPEAPGGAQIPFGTQPSGSFPSGTPAGTPQRPFGSFSGVQPTFGVQPSSGAPYGTTQGAFGTSTGTQPGAAGGTQRPFGTQTSGGYPTGRQLGDSQKPFAAEQPSGYSPEEQSGLPSGAQSQPSGGYTGTQFGTTGSTQQPSGRYPGAGQSGVPFTTQQPSGGYSTGTSGVTQTPFGQKPGSGTSISQNGVQGYSYPSPRKSFSGTIQFGSTTPDSPSLVRPGFPQTSVPFGEKPGALPERPLEEAGRTGIAQLPSGRGGSSEYETSTGSPRFSSGRQLQGPQFPTGAGSQYPSGGTGGVIQPSGFGGGYSQPQRPVGQISPGGSTQGTGTFERPRFPDISSNEQQFASDGKQGRPTGPLIPSKSSGTTGPLSKYLPPGHQGIGGLPLGETSATRYPSSSYTPFGSSESSVEPGQASQSQTGSTPSGTPSSIGGRPSGISLPSRPQTGTFSDRRPEEGPARPQTSYGGTQSPLGTSEGPQIEYGTSGEPTRPQTAYGTSGTQSSSGGRPFGGSEEPTRPGTGYGTSGTPTSIDRSSFGRSQERTRPQTGYEPSRATERPFGTVEEPTRLQTGYGVSGGLPSRPQIGFGTSGTPTSTGGRPEGSTSPQSGLGVSGAPTITGGRPSEAAEQPSGFQTGFGTSGTPTSTGGRPFGRPEGPTRPQNAYGVQGTQPIASRRPTGTLAQSSRPEIGSGTFGTGTIPSGRPGAEFPSGGVEQPSFGTPSGQGLQQGISEYPTSEKPELGRPASSDFNRRIDQAFPGRQRPQAFIPDQQRPSEDDGSYEEDEGDYSAIPGVAGRDYPILSEVPETTFNCDDQEFRGYYADVETRCQIFHICANNKTYDFLCPNGTIFHQEYLVCVWWDQFDCNTAPSLYRVNQYIYDFSITGAEQTGGFPAPGQGYPEQPEGQGPSGGFERRPGYPSQSQESQRPGGSFQRPGGYPGEPGAISGRPQDSGSSFQRPGGYSPEKPEAPTGTGLVGYPQGPSGQPQRPSGQPQRPGQSTGYSGTFPRPGSGQRPISGSGGYPNAGQGSGESTDYSGSGYPSTGSFVQGPGQSTDYSGISQRPGNGQRPGGYSTERPGSGQGGYPSTGQATGGSPIEQPQRPGQAASYPGRPEGTSGVFLRPGGGQTAYPSGRPQGTGSTSGYQDRTGKARVPETGNQGAGGTVSEYPSGETGALGPVGTGYSGREPQAQTYPTSEQGSSSYSSSRPQQPDVSGASQRPGLGFSTPSGSTGTSPRPGFPQTSVPSGPQTQYSGTSQSRQPTREYLPSA